VRDASGSCMHMDKPIQKPIGIEEPQGKLRSNERLLVGKVKSLDSAWKFSFEELVELLNETKDTLLVAAGGKTGETRRKRVTAMDMQRVTRNSTSDVSAITMCVVFNVVALVAALVAFNSLKLRFPEVYCPCPELVRLWADPLLPKVEFAQNRSLIDAIGLDGFMFLRFLRLSFVLVVVLAIVHVPTLCTAHWRLSPGYDYATTHVEQKCPGDPITSSDECLGAIHRLALEGGNWHFQDRKCLVQVPEEEATTQVCKNARFRFLQIFSIQSVATLYPYSYVLWLHTFSVLFTSASTLWMLSHLLEELADYRRDYMLKTPARSTIFVTAIPGDVTDHGLRDFFSTMYPGDRVASAFHIRVPPDELLRARGFMMHEDQQFRSVLREIDNLGAVPSIDAVGSRHTWPFSSCGFVTFQSVRDAHNSAQVVLSATRGNWRVRLAPEPAELVWNNIYATAHPLTCMAKAALATSLLALLFLLWFVPMTMLSAMANLNILRGILHLRGVIPSETLISWLTDAATSNFSAAWMALFMSLLPVIMEQINMLCCFWSRRDLNCAVERQFFSFCIFYVILVNAMTQSLLRFLQAMLSHPTGIFNMLARALPGVSSWYMCYITFSLMGLAVTVLRPSKMFTHFVYKRFLGKQLDREFYLEPPEAYDMAASRCTLYLGIAILYSSMDPFILLIAALVLWCAFMVYKYQVLCVYRMPYDTGGFWVLRQSLNVQILLAIYQLAMIGVIRGRMTSGPFSAVIVSIITGAVIINARFFWHSQKTFSYSFLPRGCDHPPDDAKPIGDYFGSCKDALRQPWVQANLHLAAVAQRSGGTPPPPSTSASLASSDASSASGQRPAG